MSYYSEYISKNLNLEEIIKERKIQLANISKLRGGRDILVYASDLSKPIPNTSIDYTDILAFQDQLEKLKGKEIDIILETPGGIAEVVEDLVKLVRHKYNRVGIIIPGWSKSAGTIFAMAGDEILMGEASALGPIDAQIMNNNKQFSAEAFLEGLEKIKSEVITTGKLNPAYIPILQNISPGEIQHCINAQDFSKKLVTQWLTEYKFKYWDKHSSTGKVVTADEKAEKANKIASTLCKQSDWLTHGRSIKIEDFERIGLKIVDFSKNTKLNEAILRYYTLLRMSFETNLYKVFETIDSQIYRFLVPQFIPQNMNLVPQVVPQNVNNADIESGLADFICTNKSCNHKSRIQLNFKPNIAVKVGNLPYPSENDIFTCPNCGTKHNLKALKLQAEAFSGKKLV
jgi:hypothetical protein